MRHATDTLRRETQTLSTALRKPQVRGRWGELHLRRAVELAGLVDRCDFTEQAHRARRRRPAPRPGGAPGRRPAGRGRRQGAARRLPRRHRHRRRRRARARTWPGTPASCAQHVDALSVQGLLARARRSRRSSWCCSCRPSRSWPRRSRPTATCSSTPPRRQVVLATPTTLIALLRTVAHGWSHEALAEPGPGDPPARPRAARPAGHAWPATSTRSGRSLNAAVGHYNAAVGSLESRVLVSARRFDDLGGHRRRAARAAAGRAATRSAARRCRAGAAACRDRRRRAATARRPASLPWPCEPHPHAAGKRAASPAARSSRSGVAVALTAVVARPGDGRPAQPVLRPRASCCSASASRCGPPARLLHRRGAAAADHGRRLRAARASPARRDRRARRRLVQAVVSGLAHHSVAPGRRLRAVPGGCLAIRQRSRPR